MPDAPEPRDTTGATPVPPRDETDEQFPIDEQLTEDLAVQGGE